MFFSMVNNIKVFIVILISLNLTITNTLFVLTSLYLYSFYSASSWKRINIVSFVQFDIYFDCILVTKPIIDT